MRSVKVHLDPRAREPLSTQLVAGIERLLLRGRLLPGDRLPSVRELAGELDLAPNTVAKAYRTLEGSGFLVGRGRRGTFVADRLPMSPDDADEGLRQAAGAYLGRAEQLGFLPEDARAALDRILGERAAATRGGGARPSPRTRRTPRRTGGAKPASPSHGGARG